MEFWDEINFPLLAWAVINVASFLAMFLDKAQSRKSGAQRFPEGVLFFLAAALGSIGILAGMFALRHKIRKWYFLLGIPLLAVQNGVFVYFLLANTPF